MKKYAISIIALVICAGFALSLVQMFIGFRQSVPVLKACRSQLVLLHGGFRLQADFNFIFSNGQGSVTVNGEGQGQSGPFIIDRRIDFTYTSDPGKLSLTSTGIRPYMGDKAAQGGTNQHLPAFFSENAVLPLSVAYDMKHHPVLSLSKMPLFWCIKD